MIAGWTMVPEPAAGAARQPACGGNSKVGTTSSVAPSVKSRSRAIGVVHTTVCGLDHLGGRRLPMKAVQRTASENTVAGGKPRVGSADQYLRPSTQTTSHIFRLLVSVWRGSAGSRRKLRWFRKACVSLRCVLEE